MAREEEGSLRRLQGPLAVRGLETHAAPAQSPGRPPLAARPPAARSVTLRCKRMCASPHLVCPGVLQLGQHLKGAQGRSHTRTCSLLMFAWVAAFSCFVGLLVRWRCTGMQGADTAPCHSTQQQVHPKLHCKSRNNHLNSCRAQGPFLKSQDVMVSSLPLSLSPSPCPVPLSPSLPLPLFVSLLLSVN